MLGKSDLLIMAQQLYQTEHGLRRLGGNTSRNPEFKFQYFTDAPLLGDLIALFNADQPHIAPVIDSELDAMIARDRPLAARVLDFLGIHYVTVDVEKSPPALLRFVDEALPLALLAEEPGVRSDGTAQTTRLYAVEPSPAVDTPRSASRWTTPWPISTWAKAGRRGPAPPCVTPCVPSPPSWSTCPPRGRA